MLLYVYTSIHIDTHIYMHVHTSINCQHEPQYTCVYKTHTCTYIYIYEVLVFVLEYTYLGHTSDLGLLRSPSLTAVIWFTCAGKCCHSFPVFLLAHLDFLPLFLFSQHQVFRNRTGKFQEQIVEGGTTSTWASHGANLTLRTADICRVKGEGLWSHFNLLLINKP